MASDGKVVFQIEGDSRGVKTTIKDVTSSIEKESKKWDKAAGSAAKDSAYAWDKAGRDIKKDAESASKGIKDSMDDAAKSTEKSADQMGSSLKGMLSKIGWGALVAQAAKFALDFGKASVQAASDLAEVQNVVDVTFGDSASQIDEWAKKAGASYGLTETQAKRYASTIGAMVKSQGIAQSEVLGMSETLAGLAADMASFYNLDFDTAFEKLRSGISGETEPLKQLGINMSAANLEAFALEQGITKSYSAMSQGEQTMLRYKYLMKATADAQGDFARTSDGLANATRSINSSIENIKTRVGTMLIPVIEEASRELSDFFDKITGNETRYDLTALDDFDRINAETEQKLDRIAVTYQNASEIIEHMEKTQRDLVSLSNGKTVSVTDLFGDMSKIESDGGDVKEYLNSIGADAEYVSQEYAAWKESIDRLTHTVPQLTEVIDNQTGAINGGTEAIKTNLDEWRKAQEEKIEWASYYAKKEALIARQNEMGGYALDADIAEYRYKKLKEAYDNGESIDYLKNAVKNNYVPLLPNMRDLILSTPNNSELMIEQAWGLVLNQAEGHAKSLREDADEQSDAIKEASEMIDAEYDNLIAKYGEGSDAAYEAGQAAEDGAEQIAEAAERTKTAAQNAAKALADYVQAVRDSTENAVNSIVKGFEKIERPTQDLFDKRSKLIEQQNELNRSTKDGEKKYQELQKQIDDLNKSMEQYTPQGMKDALESQLAFMQEYTSNLAKAREMGLSDSLLASLSDGSVQSAEYLSALVESPEMAAEIDKLYGQVQEQKESFTDALTEQKLSVDETYDAILGKALDTITDMDLEDEARDAMGATVSGLAQGIYDHVGDVEAAVNAINEVLARIGSTDNPIGFGEFSFGTLLDGSHETGLDYVPFDNYLASLHEGEGILTAEENRVWQRFKNGSSPQTMDYDALGATMRENVQAGGNVYLDGKTVGRVISDQQGNAYRQLQRSGWQQ